MFPSLTVLQNEKGAHHYKVGDLDGTVLVGYGKEVRTSGMNVCITLGHFVNDVLDGVGAVCEGVGIMQKYTSYGFFREGKEVTVEQFKRSAKTAVVPVTEIHGCTLIDSTIYYTCEDPADLNGPVLFVATKAKEARFASRVISEDKPYVAWQYYEHNVRRGYTCEQFHTSFDFRTQCYFEGDDAAMCYALQATDWGCPELEWQTIRVLEGTTVVPQKAYDLTGSVRIHIPASVQELQKEVFAPANTEHGLIRFFVEAFYDGTKEQWEAIKKGGTEVVTIPDDTFHSFYHNYGGESYREDFIDWVYRSPYVLIHCTDGDIETKDRSN